jgi:hypothetical protein
MKYEVNYLIKDENGITTGIGRKFFNNEKEAQDFSDTVNGRITAYKK